MLHEMADIRLRLTTDDMATHAIGYLALFLGFATLFQLFHRRSPGLTVLRGPPRASLFSGRLFEVLSTNEIASLFEHWANEYGLVFKVPAWFGKSCVVLCDPKAFAHLSAKDGFTYVRAPFSKAFSGETVGTSMITSDGNDHRRLRRSMTPAFSLSTLKGLLDTFYDSAYKAKTQWDALAESKDEVIVDIQTWMNRITLDTIGMAGFGHDFKTIEGNHTPVNEIFDVIRMVEDPRPFQLLQLFGFLSPKILKMPLKSADPFKRMKDAFSGIAVQLIENSRKEKNASDISKDRSILGLLLKGQAADANFKLLQEEVIGQCLFLVAGYETSSISLTWALIELARHPEIQEKLREEIRQFSGSDPTWDQLTSGLPYLDAVARESLRLHNPAEKIFRAAAEDDVMPLSTPIKTASGKVVDSVTIPKGTVMILPLLYFNVSEAIWGPDAKEFVPERWLKEKTNDTKDGRLYTFSEGPRMCLGRLFAMMEFKVVLFVFIRHFAFEFPDGPDTKIEFHRASMIPRPMVAGKPGCVIPLRVRQVA